MINVSPEVINEYLTDSTKKALLISASHTHGQTLEEVNYYKGDLNGDKWHLTETEHTTGSGWPSITIDADSSEYTFTDYVEWGYLEDNDYINISFWLYFSSSAVINEGHGEWTINYRNSNGIYNIASIKTDDILNYADRTTHISVIIPIPSDGLIDIRTLYFKLDTEITQSTTIIVKQGEMQVNFLTRDKEPKYYPPTDFTNFIPSNYVKVEIDNDNLVYEDFSLTESLCSKDNLKLGLCEAAVCEFSYVGDSKDIKVGDELVALSALTEYGGGLTDDQLKHINWYEGIYDPSDAWYGNGAADPNRVHSFNPFWNSNSGTYVGFDYTEDKCVYVGEHIDYFRDKDVASLVDVRLTNLTGTLTPSYFKIYWFCDFFCTRNDGTTFHTTKHFASDDMYSVSDALSNWVRTRVNVPPTFPLSGNVVSRVLWSITYPEIQFYDANGDAYAENAGTIDYQSFIKCPQFNIIASVDDRVEPYSREECYIYNGTLGEYLAEINAIPLGVFNVSKVAKEYKHNLVTKKVTAYDSLIKLENNAADWYTRYMFGVDFYGYTDDGFEFARQIFSTYWNYVSSIGLDSVDNYDVTVYATLNENDFICDPNNCYGYVRWDLSVGNTFYRTYAGVDVNITDNTLLYRVTYDNFNNYSDDYIMEHYNAYYVESGFDTMLRGFGEIGGVLIEEYKAGDVDPTNRICVNKGDFFMLRNDTVKIKVILPSGSKNVLSYSLCKNITVYTAPRRQDLVNGHLRLCYYNYNQKTIFACKSNITGRDVVRSLLEVCGCFFRLDRLHGLPEFVYPTKGGLYPSNTLYPADDLYPRTGTDELFSMGKYISVLAENYEVKDFGRIQILKDIKTNDTVSVCEWQYEGDPDAENTYIIDDNIFYCADDMEYDYDNMPEVADMLEGMWGVISNLGYVPNITQALGAPWLECGDRIGLLTYDGGFESFVFRRTLKGIQNLRDTYESVGDEKNDAINNFGY